MAAFWFCFALKVDIRREIIYSQEILQLRLEAIEVNQKVSEELLESIQKSSEKLLKIRLDQSEQMVQLIIQSLIDSILKK